MKQAQDYFRTLDRDLVLWDSGDKVEHVTVWTAPNGLPMHATTQEILS